MTCIRTVTDNPARRTLLRVRSLAKAFARGPSSAPSRTDALVDVSLDLRAGEVLGVVGAAGAGKSTLLQCAAGLLRRDRGFIEWFGEPFAGGGRLPDLAYVPPMPVYYPFLTVRDVLEYGFAKEELPLAGRDQSIATALARVGLDRDSSAYVCDLPREKVKRLAVAEALVAGRSVIFIDSTSSEIAPPCHPVVLRALSQEAANGRAVVIAVRDVAVIAPIASRILLLEKGRNAGTFSSDERRLPAAEPAASFAPIARLDRFVAERLH